MVAKVDEQCPGPSTRRERRLGTDSSKPTRRTAPKETIDDIVHSHRLKSAKDFAKNVGLNEEQVEDVFSTFLNNMAGKDQNQWLNDEVNKAFKDPATMEALDKLLASNIDENSNKYASAIVGRLLKKTVDPETRRLDADRLREVTSSLKIMQNDKRYGRDLSAGDERDDPDGLEETCSCTVDSIKCYIKDEISKPLLAALLSSLTRSGIGTDNAFSNVVDEASNYADSLTQGLASADGPLTMALGFVQSMDPLSTGASFNK